jgi:23S rRNA pseudouridine1911/1915/1917 synthase
VKEYLALVSGVPELLSGTVNRPIGRNATQRHKMAVVDGEPRGRDAVTDWEVVERFGSLAALVRCTLHTGRTHQIRVHMKFLGHPLLGDAIYGWKPVAGMSRTPGRIMLHAEHLALRHPITSRKLDLKAPLPDDFRAMIRSLRDDLSRLRKASSRVRRAKA